MSEKIDNRLAPKRGKEVESSAAEKKESNKEDHKWPAYAVAEKGRAAFAWADSLDEAQKLKSETRQTLYGGEVEIKDISGKSPEDIFALYWTNDGWRIKERIDEKTEVSNYVIKIKDIDWKKMTVRLEYIIEVKPTWEEIKSATETVLSEDERRYVGPQTYRITKISVDIPISDKFRQKSFEGTAGKLMYSEAQRKLVAVDESNNPIAVYYPKNRNWKSIQSVKDKELGFLTPVALDELIADDFHGNLNRGKGQPYKIKSDEEYFKHATEQDLLIAP